jgi:branched-chain amino acid transport system ATP-binding protein
MSVAKAAPASVHADLLQLRGLHAWYGESHILHGLDLDIAEGEFVTLMGRNGSGRSTTLKAILGIVGRREGSIRFDNHELTKLASHKIARLGIGYCPEERGVFSSLSVDENLTLPPRTSKGGMSLDEIFAMFPNLAERRHSSGSQLSGGEQQMLALARILRTGARLLLLDEITEGLAPVIVEQLGRAIASLRDLGFTILLVEQNFRFVAPLADRHYIIEHGRVVEMIAKAELDANMAKLHDYLGV